MQYQYLFAKGKIANLEIKNRVVMTAMGTNNCGMDGAPSEDIIRYYEARAKGGVGLIITEINAVDPNSGWASIVQMCPNSENKIPRYMKMADVVHRYDTKIFVQLHHGGREAGSFFNNGLQPVAPSTIPCSVVGEMPREITIDEIHDLVAKFVKAATVVKAAGVDGVEVHGGHGYLVEQFMSPYTNKRTDEYGGSFENRMRFATEIIQGIRAACGRAFPISVRMPGDEFLEGGLTLDDCIEIAKYFEKLGVDVLNITAGTYETGDIITESNFRKEAWKKHLGKAIKANVNIPVIATNNIKHPNVADQLIQEDVCDFVGVARANLADPEWANKARLGQDKLIRNCISCLHCYETEGQSRIVSCTVNPTAGREILFNDDTLRRDGNGRRVAIVGGGPSGMHAAIVLAKRGFRPILFDKGSQLGGTLLIAATLERKELMREFIETLKAQVASEQIDVRLNTEATPELLKSMDLYGVMVCSGGTPIIPPIPGCEGENVYRAIDVLQGKMKFDGKRVVVVGGSDTGLETAEYICANSKVTVVEMTGVLGCDMFPNVLSWIFKVYEENSVDVKTNTMLRSIDKAGVLVKDTTSGKEYRIGADAVVLALGMRSVRQDWSELENTVSKFTYIGDARRPGNVCEAMREANDKAYVF